MPTDFTAKDSAHILDLRERLRSAHCDLNHHSARARYQQILELNRRPAPSLSPYVSEAARELALITQSQRERSALWERSLKILQAAYDDSHDPELLVALAVAVADLLRDDFSGVEEERQRRWLTSSLHELFAAINATPSDSITSQLLSRRASLLRLRRVHFDLGGSAKDSTLQEATRCADKSVRLYPSAGGQLELALCKWASASSAKSDEEYSTILGNVETLLLDTHISDIEHARLTLAHFYRSAYRSVECCEVISALTQTSTHRRRLLTSIHVYAEAAIHLWFQHFPRSLVEYYCNSAIQLTQTALDSGYRNARNVVNLAMLRAVLGDVHGGDTVLHELAGLKHADIWNKLVDVAILRGVSDALSEGLLLGITSGAVWTRLGTYSWTFSERLDVTRTMYEFAEKLSPQDPVVLTNLARFYVHESIDVPESLIERLLQRAEAYSDRRFRWWKSVWSEFRGKRDHPDAIDNNRDAIKSCSLTPKRLRDVRAHFRNVSQLADAQKRGYELERIIFALAHLSFTVASEPYRFARDGGTQSQVDGYIEHRGQKYRIECKWEKHPIDKEAFLTFIDKLDVVGVSGLCISMSGFSHAFVQRVRERRKEYAVILVDGTEVESIINGARNFDELLTFKRLHFDKNSNPYAQGDAIQI